MRNLLNKKLKNEKGLTLIELLAVIVILAIIALIAIPAIGSIVSNSKSKAVLSDATAIIAGAKTAITDGACGAASNGEVICEKAELADFVEDVKDTAATYTVKFTEAKGATTSGTTTTPATPASYEIQYSNFTNLNEKYKKELGNPTATTYVKQADIAKAMGNK
ncbi:prepilin-type N-terminal cleavage/methylation domain-containing protein [Kurthia gibsonii]|uniref:prepilin-type N-terminal cleavage/methylation domain-containing protein n=1 Tax=Kurthia gibsonii TaxID=33946 RepID=UPI003F271A8A